MKRASGGAAAATGYPPLAVHLRPPGEAGGGRAVEATALLDEPVSLEDEVRTPGGFVPVYEALGTASPEPLGDWLRYTGLAVWMVALTEGLWVARLGLKREPLFIVGGAFLAALLLLLRRPRWAMAFAAASGLAALARGLHDGARTFGTSAPWGAWLWIAAPAILGTTAAVSALLWLARSPDDGLPPAWRLLRLAHGRAALAEAIRDRGRGRFHDVPFGPAAAALAVAVPFAIAWAAGASTVVFQAMLGAAGLGLMAWGRLARGAGAAALGWSPARLRADVLSGLGAAGILLLGTQAALACLDALEAALRAGPAAVAGAAAALADASAGMAREEAAATAAIGGSAGWRPYAIAALAAVAEELAFRGGLYGALRKRLPVWGALLASSVPFALLHLEPYQFVQLLLGGLVLGAVYEARRTLWAPIALHLGVNLLDVWLS